MLEVAVAEAFDVFQRKLQLEKETAPRNSAGSKAREKSI